MFLTREDRSCPIIQRFDFSTKTSVLYSVLIDFSLAPYCHEVFNNCRKIARDDLLFGYVGVRQNWTLNGNIRTIIWQD